VAKDIRRNEVKIGGTMCDNDLIPLTDEDVWWNRQDEYMAEAGDILWQLSGLCKVMGWGLEDVAKANLEKLASRKQRGVIDGEGDNR
jgi:NTP pyrophosphatase (non-canonical NTP hydrolase)